MKSSHAILLAVGVVLLAQLAACSLGSSRPSHYGAYLKKGGGLVEIEGTKGGPPKTGWVSISDRQPVIVLWEPNVVTDWLMWMPQSGTKSSDQVRFNITPIGKEGVLELKPRNAISPGKYCLIAGNIMSSPSQIPYWCFTVE